MDFLLDCSERVQESLFFSVASLLNLEVDVIFFDTTSTSWETEAEDIDDDGDSEQAAAGGDRPLRRQGTPRTTVPICRGSSWPDGNSTGNTGTRPGLQRTSQAGVYRRARPPRPAQRVVDPQHPHRAARLPAGRRDRVIAGPSRPLPGVLQACELRTRQPRPGIAGSARSGRCRRRAPRAFRGWWVPLAPAAMSASRSARSASISGHGSGTWSRSVTIANSR